MTSTRCKLPQSSGLTSRKNVFFFAGCQKFLGQCEMDSSVKADYVEKHFVFEALVVCFIFKFQNVWNTPCVHSTVYTVLLSNTENCEIRYFVYFSYFKFVHCMLKFLFLERNTQSQVYLHVFSTSAPGFSLSLSFLIHARRHTQIHPPPAHTHTHLQWK